MWVPQPNIKLNRKFGKFGMIHQQECADNVIVTPCIRGIIEVWGPNLEPGWVEIWPEGVRKEGRKTGGEGQLGRVIGRMRVGGVSVGGGLLFWTRGLSEKRFELVYLNSACRLSVALDKDFGRFRMRPTYRF